jgi:hypothetical protein
MKTNITFTFKASCAAQTAMVIHLVCLLLSISISSAKVSVKLVETFDEIRMASAKPVSQKEQALVNKVFSQLKSEKTTKLKAQNAKSDFLFKRKNSFGH